MAEVGQVYWKASKKLNFLNSIHVKLSASPNIEFDVSMDRESMQELIKIPANIYWSLNPSVLN